MFISITDLRKELNAVFLSEMIAPVIVTVNGVPAKVIVDLPHTEPQLELVQMELAGICDLLHKRRQLE